MNGWELPAAAEIGGGIYDVNADYRDVLEVVQCLQNNKLTQQERVYTALSLFYKEFESMPQDCWREALDYLAFFVDCGEVSTDDRVPPKRIDWEQDRLLIVADINKVAGCEIRALPFMHWWTFVAWFNCIGEGQLSTVCAIRDKLRKGAKLDKWEQEYYLEHKSRVDFKAKYTDEEQAELDKYNEILGV